jgi:hypothetical protein
MLLAPLSRQIYLPLALGEALALLLATADRHSVDSSRL